MDVLLYHNSRCSKSRQALDILEKQPHQLVVVEYLKNPLTFDELSDILSKLNFSPIELVRKNESIWKDYFKGKIMTNDQIIQAMVDNPKLIERPIAISNKGAVIGRPPEKVLEIV